MIRAPDIGPGGRFELLELRCAPGQRVEAGDVVAVLGFGVHELDLEAAISARVEWCASPGSEIASGAPIVRFEGATAHVPAAARVTNAADSAAPDPFGPVRRRALTRIERVAARRLQAAWSQTPQVTHFDEADLGGQEHEHAGGRLLPRVVASVAALLREQPGLNASYEPDTQSVLERLYVNVGIAVDTPQGLIVPVLREPDRLTPERLEAALAELADRARSGRIEPAQLEGGTFTVSNLGHLGGTGFTPIVNPPQIAILGVARRQSRLALREDGRVERRWGLPLALSYDHRAVDGAAAARFLAELCRRLAPRAALDSR